MAINRATIVDALDANLNEMFQDGLESWGEEYTKFCNIGTSDKQSEIDSYESGFGAMPAKTEGASATYDTIYPGIKKTYSHITYALGYEITEEAIEDNLKTPETFNKLPSALVRSGTETVEITAANIFNNGFSGSYTGFDGKALFATDHPMLHATAQGNTPLTQADLAVASLTAGLTAIEKYTDERGLAFPTKAVMLMVPVDSWNIAEELLGSEYKPLTSNIGAVTNMEKLWN